MHIAFRPVSLSQSTADGRFGCVESTVRAAPTGSAVINKINANVSSHGIKPPCGNV